MALFRLGMQEAMGMKWGSTKPGEMLTGSERWHVEISGDRLHYFLAGQQREVVHLAQLRSLHVSPGMLWASCRFDIQKGENQVSFTVDGIPNDRAQELRNALSEATADALASFVAANLKG